LRVISVSDKFGKLVSALIEQRLDAYVVKHLRTTWCIVDNQLIKVLSASRKF
jgi:hypothetical protein